jgi:pimeloyl-ACP methyl ester carboxylesterase
MTERTLSANGIEIWTEDFGKPSDPPVLLIMGASAQGIYWTRDFVDALVNRGRYVIRYDNRDVGQSSCFDFAEAPYTLDDMALDAVGVLDGYGLDSAHVVGASMGGMIVQTLAIKHRPRIRTATIIMSSPLSGGGGDAPELASGDLPGPAPEFMEKLMALSMAPADTREGRIEQRIKVFELLAGSAEPFDRKRQREIATREVDRARNFAAMNNHSLAIAMSTPADRRSQLARIDVPTLVVHGTEDPILPYAHGKALADTIPGAQLFTMDRAGHDMPTIYLNELIDRIVALGA